MCFIIRCLASLNVDFINPLIISNPTVEYGDYPVVLSGENLQLSSDNLNCDEYNWRWDGNNVVNNSGEININNVESSGGIIYMLKIAMVVKGMIQFMLLLGYYLMMQLLQMEMVIMTPGHHAILQNMKMH